MDRFVFELFRRPLAVDFIPQNVAVVLLGPKAIPSSKKSGSKTLH